MKSSSSLLMILLVLVMVSSSSHGFLTKPSLGLSQPLASRRPQSSSRPWMVESTQLWAKKKKKKEKSDTFDMKELKQRIKEVTNPYHELFATADWNLHEPPEHVHIILFKPDTDEQGLHTIEYPKGSGSNFVLAFESKESCEKFAATLEAQNFGHLSPKQYELESLESFCDTLGVFIQVVPDGKEILPPTQNVQSIGKHNPNLKDEKYRLDYIFDMFELEVDELGLLVMEADSWE